MPVDNTITLYMNHRVQKVGSANNQFTENIILEGNSLFQKGKELKYSNQYISGYTLRSVGDLNNNVISIKATNIPLINIGDIMISKDMNTNRFIYVNDIERFRDDVGYYIYGENTDNLKIVIQYKDGIQDYCVVKNTIKFRNFTQSKLDNVRFYCDPAYYGESLSVSGENIYFKDINTEENFLNTDVITISLDSSLKRIGDVFDYIDLSTGIITRMIGERKYIEGDESNKEVLTDYVNTLYKLESPFKCLIDISKKQLLLLKNSYIIIEENIVPFLNISYKAENLEKIEGYNNPLFKGAVGDGIEDDSRFIEDDWNYIQKGYEFRVNKEKSLILQKGNTLGMGKIIVSEFPYDPRKAQPQGIVKVENIKDELIISMNLPNEATPNGAQMRQRVSGVFPFEEAEIPSNYKVINAWGQIYLISKEEYPIKAIVHVANLTVLGYRESTKGWEILNNPNNIYGKLYYEDYRNSTFLNANDSIKNHIYSAIIDSSCSGRLLHLWTKQHYIEELDKDFKYICAYMDAWVTGDGTNTTNKDVLNKFVFNVGSDLRPNYDGKVRELCSGRFIKLTNRPKRCYATNLNAEIINEYCSQKLIDEIKYSSAQFYGRTFDRPIAPMPGEHYFDYEINKIIYWNGHNWCDSYGNLIK